MIEDYKPFDKIPRLHGDCVVTEKIDGTNGCVEFYREEDRYTVFAGSRNRRLVQIQWSADDQYAALPTVKWFGADNYGFGAWVVAHFHELRKLGYGRHFGEWWGSGIGRGYGLAEKRFSLFRMPKDKPACCSVVPTLSITPDFDTQALGDILDNLKASGSQAAPGFMDPEGICIYHARSGQLFKLTYAAGPKSKADE